jgi:hypothetical protein
MRIPRRVQWKGKSYRVILRNEGPGFLNRVADFDGKVIRLKRGLKKEEKLAAFLHEVCHLIAPQISHNYTDPLCEKLAKFILENRL